MCPVQCQVLGCFQYTVPGIHSGVLIAVPELYVWVLGLSG